MEASVEISKKDKRKVARTDGMVAEILKQAKIPRMCKIKQIFDDTFIIDIEGEVRKQLTREFISDKIKPGSSIAITAGSRGIANYARIIKTIVKEVQKMGGIPFIVPAMGSHGGAIAIGQKNILANYGITEEAMGCSVRATMETIRVGTSEYGLPVYIDKYAAEADGIIAVGRVKPHTAFRGQYESGLLKMMTIGLGKQKGAEICHAQGFKYMAQNLVAQSRVILKNCKILFGVAIVENAYDQTMKISAIPADKIFDEEPALLEMAKKNMARIIIDKFDVLVVDYFGKNISGDGMDPNITGDFGSPYASGGPEKQRTVVLDLTEESSGHACGFGLADFSVQRAFDKMDFETTYPNILTATVTISGKIPIILANDKLAIQAAIKTCNCIDFNKPNVVRIKDTSSLGQIYISEWMLEKAKEHDNIEILEEPKEMNFNSEGNLF